MTILSNDVGLGYYLYRNPDADGFLTAIAPTFEVHVNTPLNHRDVFDANDRAGTPDVVNLTYGVNFGFARSAVLTLGFVTPVTGPKPFDYEAPSCSTSASAGRGRRGGRRLPLLGGLSDPGLRAGHRRQDGPGAVRASSGRMPRDGPRAGEDRAGELAEVGDAAARTRFCRTSSARVPLFGALNSSTPYRLFPSAGPPASGVDADRVAADHVAHRLRRRGCRRRPPVARYDVAVRGASRRSCLRRVLDEHAVALGRAARPVDVDADEVALHHVAPRVPAQDVDAGRALPEITLPAPAPSPPGRRPGCTPTVLPHGDGAGGVGADEVAPHQVVRRAVGDADPADDVARDDVAPRRPSSRRSCCRRR